MRTPKSACRVLVVALLVSSCAATVPVNPNDRPTLVDPARTDMVAYQRDYGQCAQFANQTNAQQTSSSGAASGAVVGAVLGALVGAIVGLAVQDAGTGAAIGAAIGAVDGGFGGAAGGYAAGRGDQEATLRNCLTGRGYYLIR